MSCQKTLTSALKLEDGTVFSGISFGSEVDASGEVVFNTGMVGYPESLTDPSYKGQILVLTYPLIGNYGVPKQSPEDIDRRFESKKIQISGLIVSEICHDHSHWAAFQSLSNWLKEHNVPAISGIDTRALTKKLREKGTMLGGIMGSRLDSGQVGTTSLSTCPLSSLDPMFNPARHNLVADVSCKEIRNYGSGKKRIILVDCGLKNGIIHSLVERGAAVTVVPWDYDFTQLDYDGVMISNGPGDPLMCTKTIENIKKAFTKGKTIFGICLGNQLLALAAGAKTYKLKYGHRSQNQPCTEVGTNRCYITSQNHGYAVSEESVPDGWSVWFKNANDGTVEGIRHKTKPFTSVQFHPEARPGPTDTKYLFDQFTALNRGS